MFSLINRFSTLRPALASSRQSVRRFSHNVDTYAKNVDQAPDSESNIYVVDPAVSENIATSGSNIQTPDMLSKTYESSSTTVKETSKEVKGKGAAQQEKA
jgi:hypothetical protein